MKTNYSNSWAGGCILCLTGIVMMIFWFFLTVIITVLIGAVSAWIIGLFFGKTILAIFAAIGIKGFTMWELGAFLGFVAGFFRSNVTNQVFNKNPQND